MQIEQNSCQMTQKYTFFEKRVEKFWKFRICYYFCAPKQTGCSSARLEYTSGGRVVAGSNPVIPTLEQAAGLFLRLFFVVFSALVSQLPRPSHNKTALRGSYSKSCAMAGIL